MHTLASQPGCPFCLSNELLRGTVLTDSPGAYLIEAADSPGNYLIIPKAHAESPVDLPDQWWQEMKILLGRVPNLPAAYNIAMNVGKDAGQSVKHLHFWVIPRASGQAASGKGLARLIHEANQAD